MASEKETCGFEKCFFLAIDADLTGNRIGDEIMNMGIHGEDISFQQHVIPFKKISAISSQKHNLTTTNYGIFRVLTNTRNNEIVKTKTEIFALTSFLEFLESKKAELKKDFVLICYENRKLIPLILIESFNRYELLPRFKEVVKGFGNCYDFVKEKCAKSIQKFNLETLVKILLNKDSDGLYDASVRAKYVYEIISHLSEGISAKKGQDVANSMSPFVTSVDDVETGLKDLRALLVLKQGLKPIFQNMLRFQYSRKKALILRKYLSDVDICYDDLKTAFDNKVDFKEFLKSKLEPGTPQRDVQLLNSLLIAHFDPNNAPIIPTGGPKRVKPSPNKNTNQSEKSVEQPAEPEIEPNVNQAE